MPASLAITGGPAWLLLAALQSPVSEAPGSAQQAAVSEAIPLPEISVYGRLRQGQPQGQSLHALSGADISITSPGHPNELFGRVPGAWVSRGSGQEHLLALRSPVLTGPGACGAFLLSEDGVPIRPAGFCNVNNLFELDLRQAARVEVLRGPGTVVHGGNALHGVINVVTEPGASARNSLSVGAGSDELWRVEGRWAGFGDRAQLWASFTDAGSFREDEGYRHDLLGMRAEHPGGGYTTLQGARLDQDTAGFIFGQDAYRDPQLRRGNLNPEAYRKADAWRLTSHLSPMQAGDWQLGVTPYARTSSMEFLQHFLPGKPLEENSQDSAGVQLDGSRATAAGLVQLGLDLEYMRGELLEVQDQPTEGSAFLVETRPVGRHYDYAVDSALAALWWQQEWRLGEQRWLRLGARAEWLGYDYDNRMADGNLKDDGTPCGFGGCLYTRPADRHDDYFNLAPELAVGGKLGHKPAAPDWYVRLARGFRPPQATELYRLQNGQQVADIDSETIDSLEWGLSGSLEARLDWSVSLFLARKRDVILRDADGFNVSDGRTRHAGIEWDLNGALGDTLAGALYWGSSGSWASHEYDFTRDLSGGEQIRDGDEVDTAPALLSQWWLELRPASTSRWRLELDWQDDYYLDAANTASYPGHRLLHLYYSRNLKGGFWLQARLRNLLDRDYAERADFAFGDYRYFPGAGRSFLLELGWRAAD